jgi:cytochrome c
MYRSTAFAIALASLTNLTACGDRQPPIKAVAPAGQVAAPTTSAAAPVTTTSPAPTSIDNGKLKYATVCLGCHGQNGKGQGPFPRLAGKPAAELAAKLKDYRAGKQFGPQSATMLPFAKTLTDAEIDLLAGYLSTL